MVKPELRAIFDAILDDEIAALPEELALVLEEVPLKVEDEPSARTLEGMGMEPDEDLLGLHQGTSIDMRKSEGYPRDLDLMMLFRGPIIRQSADDAGTTKGRRFERELTRQIHVTLWHEIGHHLGLDEDDLEELGYG